MIYIKKKDVETLKDMANYISEPKYQYFKDVLMKIVNDLEKQRINQNILQREYARLKRIDNNE